MYIDLPFDTTSMGTPFSYSKRILPGRLSVITPRTVWPLRSVWTKSAFMVEIPRSAVTARSRSPSAATAGAGASRADTGSAAASERASAARIVLFDFEDKVLMLLLIDTER